MKTVHGCAAAALGCALLIFLCPASWAIDAERRPPPPPPPEDQTQDAVAYQINPGHTGSITFKTPFTPSLKQLWSRNLGGHVSYPIVAEGMVFVTVANSSSPGTQLLALNLLTGATVWQTPISSGAYRWSNAAYDNKNLFVVNFDGLLRQFTASTGAPGWTTQLSQYSFSASPIAANGQVFLGGSGLGGTLYAIDQATGVQQWASDIGNGDLSSPTLNNGALYVAYTCDVFRFVAVDGTQMWRHNFECSGGGGATSVDYDGRLYAPNTYMGSTILDDTTGNVIQGLSSSWAPSFFQDANGHKRGLLLSGTILYCFDPASTSSVFWSFTGDGQIKTPAIAINGLVIAFSNSGMLYVLSGTTGAVAWSTNTGHGIAGITPSQDGPITGLGAGQGVLLIPADNQLTAYAPGKGGGGRH